MTDPGSPPPTQQERQARGPSFGRVIRALVLWTLGWWGVLGLLLHPVIPGGWLTMGLAAALLVALPLAVFARAMTGLLYPSAAVRLLVFRPFWYVQLVIPLLATAGVLGGLAGLPFGEGGAVARWSVAATGALLALVALWGWVGSRLLVTRHLAAVLPTLPPGLEGLRIAQVSDLHVGPHTSRRHLARVVAAIRRAAPDVVVFTGDQVDDYARDTEAYGRAFAGVRAPLGVFAIPGNHDVYAGWPAVRRGLEAAGQRVLVNEAVELRRDGASLWLAGTGDPAGRSSRAAAAGAGPDIPRTLARVPPGGFVVALAHNPVLWPELAERGVPLTLSGHTHHGQLSVPRLTWSLASVFLEHAMGAYHRDRSLLYINPGTNYWGLPFRIGAHPEVTVITLTSGEEPRLVEEP